MADGSRRPLEELKPGDRVLVADPETGTTGVREVIRTHVNNDTDLTDLTVKTDDGQVVVLNTTQHHPFWSQTRHEWVFAADLQPGEQLRSADGTSATVTAVHSYSGAGVMHGLTVADIHTYYVIAGTTSVLVHNAGGYVPPPSDRVLPGFADAKFVGRGSPKAGGGYRLRWVLPDGRILEWDYQHGTVEVWSSKKKNEGIWESSTPLPANGSRERRGSQ